MGSLRTMQYNELLMKVPDDVTVLKKKPMQVLLGVLKSDVDPNRSPLGSPPTEKKRLRRLSSNILAASHNQNLNNNYLEEKENMTADNIRRHEENNNERKRSSSILKKRPTSSGILHMVKASQPTKCSHSRRVQFNGDVQVQYIGDTDSCNEPLCENQDRMAFIARNVLKRVQSQDNAGFCTKDSLQNCQSTTQLPVFQDNPLYKAPNSVTKSEQGGKSVNISFSQNSRGHTIMKFVVFMGPSYDPDNIVVKANMSGNRLRVVANKVLRPTSLNGEISKEEYNERFQLPMQVDPYKVEARLDSRGYLTVDAPLMTSDQRKAAEQKSGITL